MRLILRICDFVFVLRPLLLVPAWSFFLLGAAEAERPAEWIYSPRLLCLTCISIVAYLVNQIFDRESDRKNRKCFYLWYGVFRIRALILLALVFFFAGSVAFQRIDDNGRMALLALLVLSLLYSLPPVRLCARPFADLVANAAGYGALCYLIGYGPPDTALTAAALHAAPWVLLVAATFVYTAIPDIPGDEATGKITTAVHLGPSRSVVLATVLHGAAVLAALAARDVPALAATLLSSPLAGYAFLNRTSAGSSLYVQVTTAVVAVAAIVAWPAFAAVVLPLVFLSRFYHKRRFGITYPGRRVPA